MKIRWRRSAAIAGIIAAVGFLGLWIVARANRSAEADVLPVISCAAMDVGQQIETQPQKLRAGPEVGGMGRFQYETPSLPPHPHSESEMALAHPNVAVQAFDGWLLGGDRGEFGGELIFQRDEPPTSSQIVSGKNIEDIYKTPFGFIATASRNSMVDDNGAILLIEQTAEGSVTAETLFELPSSPRTSWLLRSNDILVNTSAGSFVVTKSRELKQVSCREGT